MVLPSLIIELVIAPWMAPISGALVVGGWARNDFVVVPSERLTICLLLDPFSPLMIRVEVLLIRARERLAWDLPGIAALPAPWVLK